MASHASNSSAVVSLVPDPEAAQRGLPGATSLPTCLAGLVGATRVARGSGPDSVHHWHEGNAPQYVGEPCRRLGVGLGGHPRRQATAVAANVLTAAAPEGAQATGAQGLAAKPPQCARAGRRLASKGPRAGGGEPPTFADNFPRCGTWLHDQHRRPAALPNTCAPHGPARPRGALPGRRTGAMVLRGAEGIASGG